MPAGAKLKRDCVGALEFSASSWLDLVLAGEQSLQRQELAAMHGQLDQQQALGLLAWWLNQLQQQELLAKRRFELLAMADLVGLVKGPGAAQLLRAALVQLGPADQAEQLQEALFPLLGYQRDPQDFQLLCDHLLAPQASRVRQAALEGIARGLAAWPLPALRSTLVQLSADLDRSLAASAVDLLARLPWPRLGLTSCLSQALDPFVAQRLERRRAAAPPSDLLLLIHGRAGGEIAVEIQQLAAAVAERRGARVLLQPLTDPAAAEQSQRLVPAALSLVPLFLLPGHHVQADLPRIAAEWRRAGWPLRRLPFLGAWRLWQEQLASLLQQAQLDGWQPQLLHHPLGSALACRYPRALEQRLGVACRAWTDPAQELAAYSASSGKRLLVPLALATNRLSEALQHTNWPSNVQLWPPLLQQPRLYQPLLEQLVSLP